MKLMRILIHLIYSKMKLTKENIQVFINFKELKRIRKDIGDKQFKKRYIEFFKDIFEKLEDKTK